MSKLLLLSVFIVVASIQALTAQSLDCGASDAKLIHLKDVVCESLGCATATNVTAQKDWPNQVCISCWSLSPLLAS